MLIAVLADIHGNLEAFNAVLDQISRDGVERIISLGDNVGYGPDPEPVMDLIRRHTITSVLGNHEMAMVEEPFISWFNPMAQKAIIFTRKHLSPTSLDEIRGYPRSLAMDGMRFVHGSPPSSPVVYLFQLADEKILKRIVHLNERYIFVGHTHDLKLIEITDETLLRKELVPGTQSLLPDRRYIINVGSVGQPRDKDKRAKYVLFDTESLSLTVKAIEYPSTVTAEKIIKAGIPEIFAQKLIQAPE